MTTNACYHCDQPIPRGVHLSVDIEGEEQPMCCPGCQAVATAIVDGGLERFYQFRTEPSARPEERSENLRQWQVYDLESVQADFVTTTADELVVDAQLLLEGITCAACSWLIEHHLSQIAGVERVSVNSASHRCTVRWQRGAVELSQIMAELAYIGYWPRPATDEQQQQLLKLENRRALMRLGVAGLGMMQVGMMAIALYAGAIQGIDAQWQQFLRWVSLLVATPVVLFSAQPFFIAAWRNLRRGHLVMDVPVSIAIGGAYLASVWATVYGAGDVYFDSVSMFTFFLLFGRYLEMRARHSNQQLAGNALQLMPLTAHKVEHDGNTVVVPAKSLRRGDSVWVKAGETMPCDGQVITGDSSVDESLLTGESRPIAKMAGDTVIAGSTNVQSALCIEVTAVGGDTHLSAIDRLVNQASGDKPQQVAMADRVAAYFVGAVLVVSVVVGWLWWQYQPSEAFWVVLSVLVVTCPCALSLATPTALTAATTWLRRNGLLVTRNSVLETLANVSLVVFDKTGTLTQGKLQVVGISVATEPENDIPFANGIDSKTAVLQLCSGLEAQSNHPIAKAFEAWRGHVEFEQVVESTAAGVEGVLAAIRYRFGRADYVHTLLPEGSPIPEAPDDDQLWLCLASEHQLLGWVALSDTLRDDAREALDALRQAGIAVELLSGDVSGAVKSMALDLRIDTWQAGVLPADKLSHIQQRQAQGETVLMVGDGINDVPVLSGADVSVAMGAATDLAKTSADSVLLNSQLMTLVASLKKARSTQGIIRQNIIWALAYNVSALPLAAMGWVPPYLAALGMSASSLVVIANALRLNRD